MTTGQASVVTAERYAKGITYQEFLKAAKVNVDLFNKYYQECTVSADDAAFLKRAKAGGATRILALGEDWCPDVYRGLPVFARIAEASGIDLKVFPRDQNLDIMQEFLNQGQFQSIPTVVFYNDKQKYLFHWIERPKFANDERATIDAAVKKELADKPEPDQRNETRRRTLLRYNAWQQATIKEIRGLLAQKLSVK